MNYSPSFRRIAASCRSCSLLEKDENLPLSLSDVQRLLAVRAPSTSEELVFVEKPIKSESLDVGDVSGVRGLVPKR